MMYKLSQTRLLFFFYFYEVEWPLNWGAVRITTTTSMPISPTITLYHACGRSTWQYHNHYRYLLFAQLGNLAGGRENCKIILFDEVG